MRRYLQLVRQSYRDARMCGKGWWASLWGSLFHRHALTFSDRRKTALRKGLVLFDFNIELHQGMNTLSVFGTTSEEWHAGFIASHLQDIGLVMDDIKISTIEVIGPKTSPS